MNQEFLDVGTPGTPLVAPSRLVSTERLDFRLAALEALEVASRAGAKAVEVDLGAVVEIDASGLGVLILLQKRARERGLHTRLVRTPGLVARMLQATQLESLFVMVTDQ
jgi:anti-anti-sigma factor